VERLDGFDLKARNLVGDIKNGEQGTNATCEYGMNSLRAGCDGTSDNGDERRTQGYVDSGTQFCVQ